MSRVRVLIIDGSTVVRRVLIEVISEDDDLEIASAAPDLQTALLRVMQTKPDVVTLDLDAHEDPFATLRKLRQSFPAMPIVLFASSTEKVTSSLRFALGLGAFDFAMKPALARSDGESNEHAKRQIRSELLPKLKAAGASVRAYSARVASIWPAAPRSMNPSAGPPSRPSAPNISVRVPPMPMPVISRPPVMLKASAAPARPLASGGKLDAIVIGTSTGGPNALVRFLPRVPRDIGVPIVIVQHMPALFTKLLAERLAAISPLGVREAAHGDLLDPSTILIAPGGQHTTLERSERGVRIALNDEPPENGCKPAVDVLFRSAARIFGRRVLAVVMTGMGQDGLRGSEAIVGAGGELLAQDEATSVVWGMPGAVARAGLTSSLVALDDLAGELMKRVRGSSFVPREVKRGIA
jgi:two-component system chemotaxis response regulator CheB